MLINVIDVVTDESGVITNIDVTDGNDLMRVTPYQIFDALLKGRMESQTARLTEYGLDIAVNSQVVPIRLNLGKNDKKLLAMRLGINTSTTSEKTSKKQAEEYRRAALEAERQASWDRIHAKQAKEAEELAKKTAEWNSLTDEQKAERKKRPVARLRQE